MPVRSLDQLDDATFDVTAARVVSGELVLHGSVVEHDTSAGTVRLPVTLTVPDAVSVVVDVADGTGELILETVDVTASAVTLRGVVPCEVVVTTSVWSKVLLDVGTTPVAVRHWWRWRPWDATTPVILDHRAVSRRLRVNACPACTHPWVEHPTEREATGATCGECDYELEHGELPPGRSVCTAQIPQHHFLFAGRSLWRPIRLPVPKRPSVFERWPLRQTGEAEARRCLLIVVHHADLCEHRNFARAVSAVRDAVRLVDDHRHAVRQVSAAGTGVEG